MGKRDCRPVPMDAADAVIAARWLLGTALPALRDMPGTILSGWQIAEDARRLEGMADQLMRKAERKRPASGFSAQIEVDDAAAFARTVGLCRPAWPLRHHPALVRLADAMRDGGQNKKRGRKALGDDEMNARVLGALIREERHTKRLAARLRQSAAWDRWADEVKARGQTLLTTDLPPPKM